MNSISNVPALAFDDVLLRPLYSEIGSRSSADISSKIGENWTLSVPIISSPMDTVTSYEMAICMAENGGLGIIHRYLSIKEQAGVVAKVSDHFINCGCAGTRPVAAAIGVNGDYNIRARLLYEHGARILCLDAAHGHHLAMKKTIASLRELFGYNIHLMAGNVATATAFQDLVDWGADSIRVGIGGGSICTTRIQTGHGIPTFQSILDCADIARTSGVKLIADGGIKNSGDIVKALAAGADFVMLGSLLAGCDETPGEIFEDVGSGKKYKSYRGMASYEAQKDFKRSSYHIEGISTKIPYQGPVEEAIEKLSAGIRSGLSYSGAKDIETLRDKAMFFIQSLCSTTESSAHILFRE